MSKNDNLNNKNRGSLKRYFYNKKWVTSSRHNSLDIDEVNHRLYNNLPLDDLIDEKLNKYKRKDDGNKNL